MSIGSRQGAVVSARGECMTVSQSVSLYIVLFFSNELNEGENYHLLNRSWLRKEGAFLVYPENFFFKIY